MKTVLITGAGRGIGLALTKEFVQKGYRVLGTYRDAKSAEGLLQLAKEFSSQVLTVVADVSDAKTFGPLKEQLKKLGQIDFVVNNSGVIGDKARSLFELNTKKMAEVLEVNTLGPLRVSQLAIPFVKKGGVVAHVSSLMGSIADNKSGGYYDYRMSKAALNMFNMCLAKEFSELVCLVLHPGWVQTDMGGAGATVTVDDCARGLFQVLTQTNAKQSGQFYDYTGQHLPW